MCWKYEDLYKGCWDFMTEQAIYDKSDYTTEDLESLSLIEWLKKNYGVQVVKMLEFDKEILHLFTRMHEKNIIKPIKNIGDISRGKQE